MADMNVLTVVQWLATGLLTLLSVSCVISNWALILRRRPQQKGSSFIPFAGAVFALLAGSACPVPAWKPWALLLVVVDPGGAFWIFALVGGATVEYCKTTLGRWRSR